MSSSGWLWFPYHSAWSSSPRRDPTIPICSQLSFSPQLHCSPAPDLSPLAIPKLYASLVLTPTFRFHSQHPWQSIAVPILWAKWEVRLREAKKVDLLYYFSFFFFWPLLLFSCDFYIHRWEVFCLCLALEGFEMLGFFILFYLFIWFWLCWVFIATQALL